MPGKQAAAAVGQCELMYTYDTLFTEYNHTVAQILLTGEDVEHEERRQNFQNTLYPPAGAGGPAHHQRKRHRRHRRDRRSATTTPWRPSWPLRQGGPAGAAQRHRRPLHRRPPARTPRPSSSRRWPELTPEVLALAGGKGSGLGTGGMATKLQAAQIVHRQRASTWSSPTARDPERSLRHRRGQSTVGTRFLAQKEQRQAMTTQEMLPRGHRRP